MSKPNNELGTEKVDGYSRIIIGEDGYPDDEFLARIPTDPDSPAACLWDAMGNLCVTLYQDPNNSPVQAAVWQIQEAIIKIYAGEPFDHPEKADDVRKLIAEMKAKHGVA